MEKTRESVESDVAERLSAGDLRAAAEALLRGYGPEILGFLHARCRSEDAADEAFSEFCEDVWKGLGSFEGRSTVRVWAFSIARHAAIRVESSPHRRAHRNLPLTVTEASRIADAVRTETAPHIRTENRQRFDSLRATLTPDEQTLLALRIDKNLSWDEIALVFSESGEDGASPKQLAARPKQLAARLRKRFQLLKDRLRAAASEPSR